MPMNPAMFVQALKKGDPSIDDATGKQIWDEVSKNPQVAQLDDNAGAQIAYTIAQKRASQPKPLLNTPNPVTGPQNSTSIQDADLSVPAANIPTGIMSDRQKQMASNELDKIQGYQQNNDALDPNLVRNAYAQHAQNLKNMQPYRNVSDAFSSISTGLGNKGSQEQNNQYWKEKEQLSGLQTIAPIEALGKQYAQGQEAVGKLLEQAKLVGDFQINASEAALKQQKMKAELIPVLQNADLSKQMGDPNSQLSMTARDQARTSMLQARKQDGTPLYNMNDVKRLIPDNATAIQVAPILGQMDKTLATVSNAAATKKSAAEAAAAYGQAAQANALAGKAVAETDTVRQGQAATETFTGVGIPGKASLIPAAPATQSAPLTGASARVGTEVGRGTTATQASDANWDPRLGPKGTPAENNPMQPSITNGVVSLNVNPYHNQKQQQTAQQLNDKQKFIMQYNTVARPNIEYAFQNAYRLAGVQGSSVANVERKAEVTKMQNSIASLNATAEAMGIVAPTEGSPAAQGVLGGLGGLLATTGNPGARGAGIAMSGAAPFLGGSRPVTLLSPPDAIKELALRVEIAKKMQEKLLPYESMAAKGKGYDLNQFVSTKLYQDVINSLPLVNKHTGEVFLVDTGNPNDIARARELNKSQDWTSPEKIFKKD